MFTIYCKEPLQFSFSLCVDISSILLGDL
uniref:Uncharacterized protein n=1 Tax=Arundo donax TaxID=35708 RepID=A0A0A9AKG6_ARUDO